MTDRNSSYKVLGKPRKLVEGGEKVTGRTKYRRSQERLRVRGCIRFRIRATA